MILNVRILQRESSALWIQIHDFRYSPRSLLCRCCTVPGTPSHDGGRLSRTSGLRVVIQHVHMGSSETCTWTNIISLPRKIGIRHMDDHKAVAVDEEYFYNRSCISGSGRATGNFFNSGTALFLTYGRRRCRSLSLECQRVGRAGDK